jgi:division protein CdvB (Snf7/Vps24/ESCRT-III family)
MFVSNPLVDEAIKWQDRALAAERENEQLKRRLASAEAELNVAVDKLEAAAIRIKFLEDKRVEAEVDRIYGNPPRS